MYDTLYREGEIVATEVGIVPVVVGVGSETNSNSAVTFCWVEHGSLVESVSSTMTCVWWLTVADCTPGPLTYI